MSRAALLLFLIALGLGLSAGLYVGWVVAPVKYVDTAPASLRQSTKDDIVLMIATIFARDQDLGQARQRLADLGYADPGPAVAATGVRLLRQSAAEADVRRVAGLAAAFDAVPPELQPFLP